MSATQLAKTTNGKVEELDVLEGVRNAAPGLKGRAIAGPHDYEQIPALVDRSRLRVANFLSDLDARLADAPFVAGDQFSVGDITALVTTDFAAKAFAISTLEEHRALTRGEFGPAQHECMRRIVFKPRESKRGDRPEAFLETDDSGGRDT